MIISDLIPGVYGQNKYAIKDKHSFKKFYTMKFCKIDQILTNG